MAGPGRGGRCRGGVPVDVLCNAQTNSKAIPLLHALVRGAEVAGVDAVLCDHHQFRPGAWRVVYGLGGHDRIGYADYPKLIAFDLAYWDRKLAQRKYRVSVNGMHCPQLIMRGKDPGPERWALSGLDIVQSGDPSGPILLIGNGPKSNAVGAGGWAERKSKELRSHFPDTPIWYRPKPNRASEPGVVSDWVVTDGSIDDVLAKVSLVVCRHSNVAVDACRSGVPVVCDDGAAAAIYPARLEDWQNQPTEDVRESFLYRLAWWQWSPDECESGQFWRWIMKVMCAN